MKRGIEVERNVQGGIYKKEIKNAGPRDGDS